MISKSIARIQTRMTCQSRKIARAIVIGGNVWVAREKSLPVFEDVKSREDNNNKTNAEKNAQCQHRFGVGMDGC
jgi:hypothetical protein